MGIRIVCLLRAINIINSVVNIYYIVSELNFKLIHNKIEYLMNTVKFLVFLLLTNLGYGQNNPKVEVSYSYLIDFSNAPEYKINSRLILDGQSSIYEMDHIGKLNLGTTTLNTNLDEDFSDNTSIVVPSEDNEYVFKNISKNFITYADVISFKEFYIEEKIPNLIWEFSSEQKTLLGYDCKKAFTEFRGRKYEAFYSEEIALSNGPWLFQGLPGLILEINCIESDDLKFQIKAFGLRKLDNQNFEITNPYENKKKLSWDDFLVLYRKKYDQTLRDNMTPNGPGYTLVKKSIMSYIKD
jgi:GLPGLI family protein